MHPHSAVRSSVARAISRRRGPSQASSSTQRLAAHVGRTAPRPRCTLNRPLQDAANQARLYHCTPSVSDSVNRAYSFSDAHFGQERDRDAKRQEKRSEASSAASMGAGNEGADSEADHEHAVISTFDLFSVGIGPSSSHTVGPMRAGKIFVTDLQEARLLESVAKIRISLYGSLAATGEGHMTPSALLLGLECADVESVDTAYVPKRFKEIKETKRLHLGKHSKSDKEIVFDYDKDLIWEWGKTLPLHSNGMRLTVFDKEGTMLATNDLFSVGGGFVVNGALSTASSHSASSHAAASQEGVQGNGDAPASLSVVDNNAGHPIDLAENMFYKEIRRSDAAKDRRVGAEISLGEDQEGIRQALPLPNSDGVLNLPQSAADQENAEKTADAVQAEKALHYRFPFRDAQSLLMLCKTHNLTIAQIVYENEKAHGYSDEEIRKRIYRIWDVMDASIRDGVKSTDEVLPGSLKLNRRAPALYRRLTRGLYPSQEMDTSFLSSSSPPSGIADQPVGGEKADVDAATTSLSPASSSSTSSLPAFSERRRSGPPRVHGSFQHPIMPSPPRRTAFPAIDYLTVYAMAVNEVNAAGGRIVTAPTNGAAGIIPAVLKYTLEFQSDDAERDIFTFLLTASAIGMLYKRGATISAAEGGCMAEVGVACSMAAAAFAACMGATPDTITQAAEIGIEHNLGLTCDPIGGLVQAPCIERNALGAIKAIASANLALTSSGTQKVSLDDAIRAMRLTAQGMRNEFKETSLSGLATSVSLNIPVSVPDC